MWFARRHKASCIVYILSRELYVVIELNGGRSTALVSPPVGGRQRYNQFDINMRDRYKSSIFLIYFTWLHARAIAQCPCQNSVCSMAAYYHDICYYYYCQYYGHVDQIRTAAAQHRKSGIHCRTRSRLYRHVLIASCIGTWRTPAWNWQTGRGPGVGVRPSSQGRSSRRRRWPPRKAIKKRCKYINIVLNGLVNKKGGPTGTGYLPQSDSQTTQHTPTRPRYNLYMI